MEQREVKAKALKTRKRLEAEIRQSTRKPKENKDQISVSGRPKLLSFFSKIDDGHTLIFDEDILCVYIHKHTVPPHLTRKFAN